MNSNLQHGLSKLEGLIKTQRECLEPGYMHGFLNGMICAHSMFCPSPLGYVTINKKYKHGKTKIRHKSRVTQKIRT